ncbi:unnamed protein product, partial [Mesorhabditis spiculigera]
MNTYFRIFLLAAIVPYLECRSKFHHRSQGTTGGNGEPRIEHDGMHELHYFYSPLMGRELKFEAVVSFGMDEAALITAEKAIVAHLTGHAMESGRDTNLIGDDLEAKFGGYWTVGIFEDPYGMAYTVARRSPMYVVFEVDGQAGILCASQGPPRKSENGRLKITNDGMNSHLLQRPGTHK